jgi:hypothetical protein
MRKLGQAVFFMTLFTMWVLTFFLSIAELTEGVPL